MTNATRSKLTDKASVLLGVTADKIPTILWALGVRQTCTRCLGSGRYSYNPTDGDRCFGCSGKGQTPAKLTKATFAVAAAKVEAGELTALRIANRARLDAGKEIAPLVYRAKEIYAVIGGIYEKSFNEGLHRGERVNADLLLAQTMNNSIFWGDHTIAQRTSVSDIASDVKSGRRKDVIACKAELEEAVRMLERLRDSWLAYSGSDAN